MVRRRDEERYDETDCHTCIFVSTAECIYNKKSLVGKFFDLWWTSDEYKNDNHPATEEAWKSVKDLAIKELSNKRLFVVDAFCGANNFQASSVAGWLSFLYSSEVHHTVSFEFSSITMYLSFGERPV